MSLICFGMLVCCVFRCFFSFGLLARWCDMFIWEQTMCEESSVSWTGVVVRGGSLYLGTGLTSIGQTNRKSELWNLRRDACSALFFSAPRTTKQIKAFLEGLRFRDLRCPPFSANITCKRTMGLSERAVFASFCGSKMVKRGYLLVKRGYFCGPKWLKIGPNKMPERFFWSTGKVFA